MLTLLGAGTDGILGTAGGPTTAMDGVRRGDGTTGIGTVGTGLHGLGAGEDPAGDGPLDGHRHGDGEVRRGDGEVLHGMHLLEGVPVAPEVHGTLPLLPDEGILSATINCLPARFHQEHPVTTAIMGSMPQHRAITLS